MTEIKTHLEVARYWNANGQACCIVATITEGVDWVAHVNGVPREGVWREKEAIDWVAEYGCKLIRSDAQYFFPNIKLPYRD